ncbi:bifunctional (p)ppGpp synthetase/guanosine-3',5'-bis(diphosphate) 3'-pyrophosphohydrolase [Marinomonas sp. 15G1-11]|uniref:guanosine-3',5'-bis(diphosphate) 3'-diphosphatase n=1 Tax=Marinomonas phaeophyticola TaxID=3004091 RepID=A0ABT4JWA7_9GAMM|nr:bifunctional (p)ppGpp synthetase/guanosine-3',5'-bis(diphosphate) 3'-pyrophosphohydrolase [Marinomonas sp. 15G1-11]MCZ2722667.1 bifunctional (p)ppGpp synthetase/guanosine-3',5'-bis(diphosphate) 3'-pyrophosphohydrolase [Marinomonas sp. 15G1-11]
MYRIEDLAVTLSQYLPYEQVSTIKRAYYYAEQAHDGQRRKSGEPYVIHPLAVAQILADLRMDCDGLTAALLHDVIEDTGISREALTEQFGESVASLVDGVSKLTHLEFNNQVEKQAHNFQKMAMAMAEDIRVILVKLADRLHNMRTLDSMPAHKKRRIAKETLDIYAPIANRLGMYNFRVDLESLAFDAYYPMRSRMLQRAIHKRYGQRAQDKETLEQYIHGELAADYIEASISVREKHIYSIYQKMQKKRRSLGEIMDVLGVRIVTDKSDNCYRILGIVHSLFKPVEGRFKDYIAVPKSNGYQSLHTTVVANGLPMEVQIRTTEMEMVASNGIAAHWAYKASNPQANVSFSHDRAMKWAQGLIEIQQKAGNAVDFVDNVKNDLFPGEVYVFTPKGEIVELPTGATPVDFAYGVHTEIGNNCISCRINRRLAPLSTQLESGQTVEIITAKNAQPNVAWLSFAITGKARTNIRHYLKDKQTENAIAVGRRLLTRSLNAFKTNIDDLVDEQINQVLEFYQLSSLDELLESIGKGRHVGYLVARQLFPNFNEEELITPTSFKLNGSEGMLVSYAKCCSPIPGDPIAGYVQVDKGIVIHHLNCPNIQDHLENPERYIRMSWGKEIEEDLNISLIVSFHNERGAVSKIASSIGDTDYQVSNIVIIERGRISRLRLNITVSSRIGLADVMRRIKSVRCVDKVIRETIIAK